MNLEIEFSPSRSSNRAYKIDPEELVDKFVRIHREETDRVRMMYPNRCGVRYGCSKGESVDIYYKDEESGPVFVYVHGGYWIALDRDTSGICVAPLVEQGYRVVIADYNLCPTMTLEEIVVQTRRLFEFVVGYALQTNAQSVSLCGHSAGAHLIATLLQEWSLDDKYFHLVKRIFLISGIYDLRELWQTEAGNPRNILSLTADLAVALSPVLYNSLRKVQGTEIHVVVAEHDSNQFKVQSKRFAEKLQTEGISSAYVEFPDYDHFNIIEELRNKESNITKYLLKTLK